MKQAINDLKSTFKRGRMFTKLIMINVAAFVLYWLISIFFPQIGNILTMPGSPESLIFRPWTPITYMFLHGSFLHLLFNMLWLFWFGQIFISYLNDKQLLAIYLMGGIIGAFLHFGVNVLLPLEYRAGIVGASASVMAVAFAISFYQPDYPMRLLFIGEVKLKYIAYFALFLDIVGALQNIKGGIAGSDGVAHIAHMGGALYGILFAYQIKKGKDITRRFNNFLNNFFSWTDRTFNSSKTKRKATRVKFENFSTPKSDWEYNEQKAEKQEELDRILDKISAGGYESLTKEEKDFLFRFNK